MNHPAPNIKLSCIIDDDHVYVNLVKRIIDIKSLSENLLIFKNGREAIEHFKILLPNIDSSLFPEIILLDLNMPIMDGWEFLKEFTQITPPKGLKTTLYVVSSSIDPYEIERAKAHFLVKDYLIKPVNLNDFEMIFRQKIG